jgi:ribosomal protein S27AE
MALLTFCLFVGLAGGFIGKVKGSSFWLWFVVSAIPPWIGVVAALLYRVERDELRRQCPDCGKVVKLYDALCTRCGAELEFPEAAIGPESGRQAAR